MNDKRGNHSPSWSPDCRKIAYERDGEVYVVEADGSGQSRLCEGSSPAWSPDGERISFTKGGALYVTDADGSDQRMLVQKSSNCSDPDWSPDGARIVFSTFLRHEGSLEYFVNIVDADGSPPMVLCGGKEPAWSPDGGRIAFARSQDGLYDIYTIDPEGSHSATALTGNEVRRADFWEPDWSPDGAVIVYRTYSHLRVIGADGSNDAMLTGVPHGVFGQPAWSPDGARIAFTFGSEICTINADGSNFAQLTYPPPVETANDVGIKRVVFCMDLGGGEYTFFFDEADALLFALAIEVEKGIKTPKVARTVWEPYEDEWPELYDPDYYDEEDFPYSDDVAERLPVSSGFWGYAAGLGIPGVVYSESDHPGGSARFEVRSQEAFQTLTDECRDWCHVIATAGEHTGGWSAEETEARIQQAREGSSD